MFTKSLVQLYGAATASVDGPNRSHGSIILVLRIRNERGKVGVKLVDVHAA